MKRSFVKLALVMFLVSVAQAALTADTHHEIKSIYWSDGDSGRITKPDGTVVKFRLDDWDAPETGAVGAAVGPAQCELERERGFAAKAFMVERTRAGATYTHNNERDGVPSRDALLVTIYVDGANIQDEAVKLGHLQQWLHDGSKALEDRPRWCD